MNPLKFKAIDLQVFSSSFSEAQSRFLKAQNTNPLLEEKGTVQYSCAGPHNEPLSIDWSWIGPKNAKHVLVLISGTHGVEGYAGSAIQTAVLRQLDELPKSVACLFVHGLNPYGFAWSRRCDNKGIDINRNFINFDKPIAPNSKYAELHTLLVPENFEHWKQADTKLSEISRSLTDKVALEKAITEGQSQFPDGLFYSGNQPSESRIAIESLMTLIDDHERKNVAVIDFHTGLGPYGHGEIICEHETNMSALGKALRWYGECVTEPSKGTSISPPKNGLMDYGWEQAFPETICYITLEFGTFPKEYVLRCLRQDHCLHQQENIELDSTRARRIKRQLTRAFYPNTQTWNELVIYRGQQVIAQAINGMCQKM